MPTDKTMLTVAEVLELPAGDSENATWINPGFIARVDKIVSTKGKQPPYKEMQICTLVDPDHPARELMMTLFRKAAPFREGDVIEVAGKGLRRTEYRGAAQATPGQETTMHVLTAGTGAHRPAARSSAAAGDGEGESFESARPAPDTRGGGRDKGEHGRDDSHAHRAGPINGQTVGMAVKLAGDILIHNCLSGTPQTPVDITTLENRLVDVASQIIRASQRLEAGKLSDPGEPVDF